MDDTQMKRGLIFFMAYCTLGSFFAPTGADHEPGSGANRASRDLNRRLGLGPKTASWPMPRLRFNPAGFAPPPDTNLVFTRHEQFCCHIDASFDSLRGNDLVDVCND